MTIQRRQTLEKQIIDLEEAFGPLGRLPKLGEKSDATATSGENNGAGLPSSHLEAMQQLEKKMQELREAEAAKVAEAYKAARDAANKHNTAILKMTGGTPPAGAIPADTEAAVDGSATGASLGDDVRAARTGDVPVLEDEKADDSSKSSDEAEEPSSESEDEDGGATPASNGRTAVWGVDEDGREESEGEGDSPEEQMMGLTPQEDDEKSSSSEVEADHGEGDGDSPDAQRVELTPPSEDEQGEGSSSTLAKSASTGEVATVQSEQARVSYNTRSRSKAKLFHNKT